MIILLFTSTLLVVLLVLVCCWCVDLVILFGICVLAGCLLYVDWFCLLV